MRADGANQKIWVVESGQLTERLVEVGTATAGDAADDRAQEARPLHATLVDPGALLEGPAPVVADLERHLHRHRVRRDTDRQRRHPRERPGQDMDCRWEVMHCQGSAPGVRS